MLRCSSSALEDHVISRQPRPSMLYIRAFSLWTIYPKGRGVAFGEREIRTALRAAGFRDTKSCAVSGLLTATRYNYKSKRPGGPA